MNTTKQLTILALIISSTAACAQVPQTPSRGVSFRDTAHVTDIKILTQRFNQPQQVCTQVPATQTQTTPQAKRGYGGALIGGAAGGLIGQHVPQLVTPALAVRPDLGPQTRPQVRHPVPVGAEEGRRHLTAPS